MQLQLLPEFTLDLELAPATQKGLAKRVAAMFASLQMHECISIKIGLHSAQTFPPSASILQCLSPCLTQISFYDTPGVQPAGQLCSNEHDFTAHQVIALQHHSTNLQVLSIMLNSWKGSEIDVSIAAIATCVNLTKLHLSLIGKLHAADFSALGRLTRLQDLALLSDAAISCGEALTSSKQYLQSLYFSAPILTDGTYEGLAYLSNLDTLLISVDHISIPGAIELSLVTASLVHVNLVACTDPDQTLRALVVAGSQIHKLTVACMTDIHAPLLAPFVALQTLVIVDSPGLSCELMPVLPSVTELTLVTCIDVTPFGLEFVCEVALPNLSTISFCSQLRDSQYGGRLHFEEDELISLALGQKLTTVDLRGVSGLNLVSWLKLRTAIASIQFQPEIVLHIPVLPHDETQHVVQHMYGPHLCIQEPNQVCYMVVKKGAATEQPEVLIQNTA